MPRQARRDAPGTLHHVFIRGIERKEIVKDDHDSQNFVYRMGTIAIVVIQYNGQGKKWLAGSGLCAQVVWRRLYKILWRRVGS